MARGISEYKNLLLSLLPKGKLWTRQSGTLFVNFFRGLAGEFKRVDDRIDDLLKEFHVTTTNELLEEHETDFGLPDNGFSLAATDDGRREELLTSLVQTGGQDKYYYEELAENLGYDVNITQYQPFWAGIMSCGDPCGPQNNLFYWKVGIEINSVEEPMEVNISKLIYKVNATKPAHTKVLYDFEGLEANRGVVGKKLVEFDRSFGRAFDRIPYYDNLWGLVEEKELDFGREFSNAFANAYDYYGANLVGPYNAAFSIAFDRYTGGSYTREFSDAFNRME